MNQKSPRKRPRHVICVRSGSFAASLEPRKVYRVVERRAEKLPEGYIRIVDESGEDYVYPAKLFVPVALPPAAERALSRAG